VAVDLRNATGLDYTGLQNFGFGLFSRESPTENYCTNYSANEESLFVDEKWREARAMSLLANVCGGITVIIAICLSCVSIPQMFLKQTAGLSFFAGLFQCLTFIYFASDACDEFDCRFSQGAGVAVGATVMYMFNTFILLKIPPYEGHEEQFTPATNAQDPPPGSVQVTVTEMPDGSKKTTRTVVNADGSKTVTETMEQPAEPTMAFATAIQSGSSEPAKMY